MSFREIVSPENIEITLQDTWEKLAKKSTTRASLFNLVVFAKLNSRLDYAQQVVAKLVEKFPCRVLFISWDPQKKESFLKTAVSVIFLGKDLQTACDHIDFAVAGEDLSKIPFLLLPHFLSDLPIYLLWTEEFLLQDPLFEKLHLIADRIIFDSEIFDNFALFLENLTFLLKGRKQGLSDLNWIRTEKYRNMITSHFSQEERKNSLQKLKRGVFSFNSHTSSYFSHVKIQALYLQAWIASCLCLRFKDSKKTEKGLLIEYEGNIFFELNSENKPELAPGSIWNLELQTENTTYFFERDSQNETGFLIKTVMEKACELPYFFPVEKGTLGLSLSKEITNKGTSNHYKKTLPLLKRLESSF